MPAPTTLIPSVPRVAQVGNNIQLFDPSVVIPPMLPVVSGNLFQNIGSTIPNVPSNLAPLSPDGLSVRGITADPNSNYYMDPNGGIYRVPTQNVLGTDPLGQPIVAGQWVVVTPPVTNNPVAFNSPSGDLNYSPAVYAPTFHVVPTTFVDAEGNVQVGVGFAPPVGDLSVPGILIGLVLHPSVGQTYITATQTFPEFLAGLEAGGGGAGGVTTALGGFFGGFLTIAGVGAITTAISGYLNSQFGHGEDPFLPANIGLTPDQEAAIRAEYQNNAENMNSFMQKLAKWFKNQAPDPITDTPPPVPELQPVPITEPKTVPTPETQPQPQPKPDPTDTDEDREIDDQGIIINAQIPVQQFNVSEMATATPVPFLANDGGKPGLDTGPNPNFGTSIAAQALKAAIKAHPVINLPVVAPIPGNQTAIRAGPGTVTSTNPNATTGVISGVFAQAGVFGGGFQTGTVDAGGYAGPIFQAGLGSIQQIPVPLPPPQSGIFTGGVYMRELVPPGFWIGGVDYIPAPTIDPQTQASMWQFFIAAQVPLINGVPTFTGPPNTGWSVTVATSSLFTSGNPAPLVPGMPGVGTVIAQGNFDSNGHSPAPDITVLPSYYLPTQPVRTAPDGHPDHIEGPYDGNMDPAISFALTTGIARTGIVYVFHTINPASAEVIHARGYTWRHPNNSPWSVPAGFAAEYLQKNGQTILRYGGLAKTYSDWYINGASPTGIIDHLDRKFDTRQYIVGKNGRSDPPGSPPIIDTNEPNAIPGVTPRLIPFGGYQFGLQYSPKGPNDPFFVPTHFIQAVGSDSPLLLQYFNARSQALGNQAASLKQIVTVGGLNWTIDNHGSTTNPFYDGVGAAGRGAFLDAPSLSVFVPDPIPIVNNGLPFQAVPRQGVQHLFAMALAWILRDTNQKSSLFIDYVDQLTKVVAKDFVGPNGAITPINIGLSSKGWCYQYRATPSDAGDLLTEDIATKIVNIWTDGVIPNSGD